MIPISWNMHKHLKETGFLTMGAKEHKRYKGKAGVQRYSFAPAFGQRINSKLIVTLDNIQMVENHDYHVDYHNQEIVFDRDVQRIHGGEIIVIHIVEEDSRHIMILRRKTGDFEFDEEHLWDLLSESIDAQFDVDQLIRNFPEYNETKLMSLKGRIITVKQAKITPDGIIATDWVVAYNREKLSKLHPHLKLP